MAHQERNQRERDAQETDQTVHGGEGDPLGGGVAQLDESAEVTEGEPRQEG